MLVLASSTSSSRSRLDREIAGDLGEITGESVDKIMSEIATNPSHNLAIPSPRAMTILGKLRGRYGIKIRREDIQKTKRGGFCSMSLLVDLAERKLAELDGSK